MNDTGVVPSGLSCRPSLSPTDDDKLHETHAADMEEAELVAHVQTLVQTPRNGVTTETEALDVLGDMTETTVSPSRPSRAR